MENDNNLQNSNTQSNNDSKFNTQNDNGNRFQVVSDSRSKNNFNSYSNSSKKKNSNGFIKTFAVPFFSGVLGCSLVLATCFGVPEIKEKIIGKNVVTSFPTSSQSTNTGTITQVDLVNYSNTAIAAANKILPSIVGIEINYTVTSSFFMFGGQSTSTATASGSGIIISEDGYILTNNHVVDTTASSSSYSYYELSKANSVKVKLYGNDTTYDAKIVGQDSKTDLAVLKIEATGLTAAEFANSDEVKIGEFTMAIGNPLGLGSSITCGVVSAVNREVSSDGTTYNCIQTDAAINSGNSGGALVNSDGKVIGVNTLKLSGTGVEGISFAIPINSTLSITSDLIEHNKVLRPYIGITTMDLSEERAKQNNLVEGIYVKAIDDFSAAEKAGIKIGDVIVKAEGQQVKTTDELNKIKDTHKIGDEMTVTVNRNGSEKELTVKLQEAP